MTNPLIPRSVLSCDEEYLPRHMMWSRTSRSIHQNKIRCLPLPRAWRVNILIYYIAISFTFELRKSLQGSSFNQETGMWGGAKVKKSYFCITWLKDKPLDNQPWTTPLIKANSVYKKSYRSFAESRKWNALNIRWIRLIRDLFFIYWRPRRFLRIISHRRLLFDEVRMVRKVSMATALLERDRQTEKKEKIS